MNGVDEMVDLTNPTLAQFIWSPFTKRAIFVFHPETQDRHTDFGSYVLSIDTSAVLDEHGMMLVDNDGTPLDGVYTSSAFVIVPYAEVDFDQDEDIDLQDYSVLRGCLSGPDILAPPPGCDQEDFSSADMDGDNDVDLADFAEFSGVFGDYPGVCCIVGSTPQDGWIDARQPIDNPEDQNPAGWDSIELTFPSGCDAGAFTSADFTVTEVCEPGECDESGPEIDFYVGDGNTGTLTLDRPIDPKTWTIITFHGGEAEDVIRLGYLPADADGSRASLASDILEVTMAVQNGGPLHQYDIDRSGQLRATDISVLIDLLNGAYPFESYWDKRLPPMP